MSHNNPRNDSETSVDLFPELVPTNLLQPIAALTSYLVWLVLILPAPLNAQVYRYVDETGQVHYTDQPPEDESKAESVDVKASQRTTAQQANAERLRQQTEAIQQRIESKAAGREQSRAEQREQAKQNRANCETARKRLTVFETSNRTLTTNAKGEAVYFSEQQRQQRQQTLEQAVQKYCN